MIIQPIKIAEFPDEKPGEFVFTVYYKLPVKKVFTIRYFTDDGLVKTETKDTADQTAPLWWTFTSKIIDGVPQMQVVVSDEAPSAATAKHLIPPSK